jgi:hypothetical protein
MPGPKPKTTGDKANKTKPWDREPEETLLNRWMLKHGVTVRALALELGCCTQVVHYWRNGQQLPSLVYAFKLEQRTKGQVPVSSWLGTRVGKLAWSRDPATT